ncbi:MAG: outer membrane lipoprotein-sorting protein [Candidatus Omnitrophota bacterium]
MTVVILFLAAHSHAEGPTAKEIVKRSDDLMRGDTSDGIYEMTVVTPDWKRTLRIHASSSGRDKTFMRILHPPTEEDITTLRIDYNMWNYLPNVERTIKIPPSMMFQPWMGSDFNNDDLVKESSVVNDYVHTILADENIDSHPAYKIDLDPKPEAAVTWGKLILWVRKADFVPLRQEFYAENGKLIKVLEYSGIKEMSDRVIPTIWKMTSVTKRGRETTIVVKEVTYNEPISDDIFSLSNLKSPR